MPINLPLAEYKFTYNAIDSISVPAFSGSLWHSVFGKALKDVSCIAPDSECKSCLFYKQCDYPLIFRGVADKPPKQQTLVSPHIFQSSSAESTSVPPKGRFSIKLLLVGSANQRLAGVIQAMHKIGLNGLGKHRSKLALQGVTRQLSGYFEQNLLSNQRIHAADLVQKKVIPEPIERVRLQFTTPFKFSGKAANTSSFQIDFFLMMLIRRLSSLQYYYTDQALEADFKTLKTLTQTVPVTNNTMSLIAFSELSHRNCLHKQSKGWIGHIDLDLSRHHVLWEFLFLGQWMNVGKNANMGFGSYQLVVI